VLREDCHRILELPAKASTEEIKQAYRDLVRVWHPDRFTDDRLRRVAEQKLKQINVAYEALLTNTFDSPPDAPPEWEQPTEADPTVAKSGRGFMLWLGIAIAVIITGAIAWRFLPTGSQPAGSLRTAATTPSATTTAVADLKPVPFIPAPTITPPTERAPASPADFVLMMNGAREYVTIPWANLKVSPDALTVECWAFVASGPAKRMFLLNIGDGGDAHSQRTFDLWRTQDEKSFQFELFLEPRGYTYVRTPEVQDEWIHLAATYDAKVGLLTLYTNGLIAARSGVELTSKTPLRGKRIRQTGYGMRIGNSVHSSANAKGYIDEVRIWTRARSSEEIRRDMNLRLAGNEPHLSGYWNFDVADFKQMKDVQIERNPPQFVLRKSVGTR